MIKTWTDLLPLLPELFLLGMTSVILIAGEKGGVIGGVAGCIRGRWYVGHSCHALVAAFAAGYLSLTRVGEASVSCPTQRTCVIDPFQSPAPSLLILRRV